MLLLGLLVVVLLVLVLVLVLVVADYRCLRPYSEYRSLGQAGFEQRSSTAVVLQSAGRR